MDFGCMTIKITSPKEGQPATEQKKMHMTEPPPKVSPTVLKAQAEN